MDTPEEFLARVEAERVRLREMIESNWKRQTSSLWACGLCGCDISDKRIPSRMASEEPAMSDKSPAEVRDRVPLKESQMAEQVQQNRKGKTHD